MQAFRFADLPTADLHVDAIYEGGRAGHSRDDPFSRLLSVSNMGGFRYRGNLDQLEMVVLTTSGTDPDWPDALDPDTGVFTYYGDNKKPGRALHDTPRNGNELLRRVFELAHGDTRERTQVPPTFVFANTGKWRDARFLGLAVPGNAGLTSSEDLVAVWRNAGGNRFQNYRARFTVLDVPVVSRAWITDVIAGHPRSANAPPQWLKWVETGRARPLLAARSIEYRSKAEQLPQTREDERIVEEIRLFFRDRPHDFEACAAEVAKMLLPGATTDLTRVSRDGGRDAIGQLVVGRGASSIVVDFALEAKCYAASNSVGVKELSRLISRLRHRQFGVLVTTSYLNLQAYQELKEDRHPVIVVGATDVVNVLRANGLGSVQLVRGWLVSEFTEVARPK